MTLQPLPQSAIRAARIRQIIRQLTLEAEELEAEARAAMGAEKQKPRSGGMFAGVKSNGRMK